MNQNTVATGEVEFDPARERTTLVNALAEAARAALDFDFMSAAVLGAIPGTEPQQYVIAGTPAGISKMLQAVASPLPVSEAQAEPDECGANMNGHRFGPHGRNGERQCEWCGAAPTAKEAEQASAQTAEVRDVARYRFLRDSGVGDTSSHADDALLVYRGFGESSLLPDQLDAAIDAAIRSAVGTGEQA